MPQRNSASFIPSQHRNGQEALIEDPELLKRFGITRVGDVTGLDTIGVPVWFAVRPNSRGISVSQGKGVTAGQAKLSAVMEAIEGAVAEDVQRHVTDYGSIRDMQRRGMRLVPLDTIARVERAVLEPDRERAWVPGISLRDNAPVFAPFELIGMDFRADFPWDRQAFAMSSQGLAAGFDEGRAILHAVQELIENDACFVVDAFETRMLGLRPISFQHGISSTLDGLIARAEKAGLTVWFFDLTRSNGVPVIMASLPRPVLAADGPGTRFAAGIACRLDAYDAAIAALLEAIQSRLTDISGARDDLSPARYSGDPAVGYGHETPEPFTAHPAAVDRSKEEPHDPPWRRLVHHLFAGGVDDIFLFPLDTGLSDITVVRVLASGLAAAGAGVNKFTVDILDGFLRR